MSSGVRRWVSMLLRLAVCLAAVAWLATHTEWAELKQVWRQADKGLLSIGILSFGPSIIMISLRQKWLLAVHNVHISTAQAIKVTFAGNFISSALPLGTTGGDTVKAWYIARDTPHKHEAVITVFFDRLVGVVGLVLMAGLVLLANWGNPAFAKWGRLIAVLIVLFFVGASVYFSRRLRRLFRIEQITARLPWSAHLQRIDRAVFAFRHGGRRVAASFLITAVLQFNGIISLFLMGWALQLVGGRPLSAFAVYLGYIPICFLSGVLPIGVMEVTFQKLFSGAAGLGSPEAAISLSLMCRFMQLLWALPGALTLLKGRPAAVEESFDELGPTGNAP